MHQNISLTFRLLILMVLYDYIIFIYLYDVNIRCVILITELYRLFDIVTESAAFEIALVRLSETSD